MDEPTAAITDREVELLFEHIRSLTAKGRCHYLYFAPYGRDLLHLRPYQRLPRRSVTSVRATPRTSTRLNSSKMMVGREITDVFPSWRPKSAMSFLRRRTSSARTTKVKGVSLSVRRGEILGIGGLVGAGRSEAGRGHLRYARAGLRRDLRQGQTGQGPFSEGHHQGGAWPSSPRPKVTGLNLSGSVNDNIAMVAIKSCSATAFTTRTRHAPLPWSTSKAEHQNSLPATRLRATCPAATSRRSLSPSGC